MFPPLSLRLSDFFSELLITHFHSFWMLPSFHFRLISPCSPSCWFILWCSVLTERRAASLFHSELIQTTPFHTSTPTSSREKEREREMKRDRENRKAEKHEKGHQGVQQRGIRREREALSRQAELEMKLKEERAEMNICDLFWLNFIYILLRWMQRDFTRQWVMIIFLFPRSADKIVEWNQNFIWSQGLNFSYFVLQLSLFLPDIELKRGNIQFYNTLNIDEELQCWLFRLNMQISKP